MFERNRPSNTILADRNYARSLGRIVDQPPVLDLAHFVLGADGHMNFLCMGGCTVGPELAWDLVQTFLAADFSQAARHLRRLAKSLPRRP